MRKVSINFSFMNYIFLKSPYNINAFLQWNEQYYTRTTKKVSFKALIE